MPSIDGIGAYDHISGPAGVRYVGRFFFFFLWAGCYVFYDESGGKAREGSRVTP